MCVCVCVYTIYIYIYIYLYIYMYIYIYIYIYIQGTMKLSSLFFQEHNEVGNRCVWVGVGVMH
jgi:hypothetical protein